MSAVIEAKRTPLYEVYPQEAKIEDFHHWLMPINFQAGIIVEHQAVRERYGFTDVSHMGELEFLGSDTEAFLEHVFTNNIRDMKEGQARYGMLCDDRGVIIDDDIVYKMGGNVWRMVVNAASIGTVYNWLNKQSGDFSVGINNISDETTLIALHGPKSAEVVSQLAPTLLSAELKYYQFKENVKVGGIPVTIAARTGYTGENGVEFMSGVEEGRAIWKLLLEMGITPYGLGARNTLRAEVGLPLGGNDISRELDGRRINPLEAGLGRFVDFGKYFIGKQALEKVAKAISEGNWDRQFVGLMVGDRGIPRDEMDILVGGRKIGTVTTGIFSPTLMKGIGMGYVEPAYAAVDTDVQIDIRGKHAAARIESLPLYKKGTAGKKMVV